MAVRKKKSRKVNLFCLLVRTVLTYQRGLIGNWHLYRGTKFQFGNRKLDSRKSLGLELWFQKISGLCREGS